jgi:tetratricopeptide (TPR) repeat protein
MKQFVLFIVLCISLQSFTALGQSPEDPWTYILKKDFDSAEIVFKERLSKQPKDIRLILGLSYLLEMRHRNQESWNVYKNIMQAAYDPIPYIYSIWLTPRFSTQMHEKKSGVQDILKQLSLKGDKAGSLRAMAMEMLGSVETRNRNFKAAKQYYDGIKALSSYQIIGPFEHISASGFNIAYPPEDMFDTTQTYEGKNGTPASWFSPPLIKKDYWLDFQSYYPDRQAIFYANTFVWSPKKAIVNVRIGTSGSVKVFLNDAEIIRDSNETNNDFDTYIVRTELSQGWNRLLVKVGYSEIDRCNFLMRITDDEGKPIEGLKESAQSQQYNKQKPRIIEFIPNPIIATLQSIIDQHPDWIEHYLLLADAYLRNDRAIEAELLLKKALTISKDNPLILWKFLDTYARGRKKDEVNTTYELLASMSKDIPDGIIHKFNQHLQNEDYDRAEDMVNRIEQLLPGSETAYTLRIRYYDKKRMQDKVISTVREARKKYPKSWTFTELAALFDYQATRKRDTMIGMFSTFLKATYAEAPLLALAKAYLDDSKVKDWEKTFAELLEMSPSSPGFYFQMASVYTQLEQYDKAEKAVNTALKFCPSCNSYWSKLGEISRSKKDINSAIASYQKALRYSPTDYDARAILRELQGKKSIFMMFGESNIDSILRVAPSSKDHPEASAAIVSEKVKRVVYEQGASESVTETIIRVFNEKGIDYFKEYRIGYNGNSQSLTIEKAVTIKADGKEIRADINRNMAVFKGLEANDFIYVKYRMQNYNTGKLAKHVWDEFYFNRFFPVTHAEYALIMPNEMQFTTSQQAMDITPKEMQLPELNATLYSWSTHKEPGIVYEADMPSLQEIGKTLRFTTIPNWVFLVDWYAELAQSKAQSSYEIKEAVKQLIPAPETLSEKEKIQKVFQFITDNIRYSSVSFRQSAFIPQKARDVLVNKIGDCKDVSTLGIAMLRELGIKADYVLVNSGNEERLLNVLPSIAFNHCIIAVQEQGKQKPLFLDLTASNFPTGVIPAADKNAFSLLIKQGVTQPLLLPDKQLSAPTFTARSTVQFSDDGMIIQGIEKVTGTLTAQYRSAYKGKTFEERKKLMQTSLASDIPSAKINSLVIMGADSLSESISVIYQYEAPNTVAEAGTYKIIRIPWRNELSTDNALTYENRSYPVKNMYDIDTTFEEVSMIIPKGYALAEIPQSVVYENSAADYSFSVMLKENQGLTMLTAKRIFIKKKTFIEPNEYQEYKTFYAKAVREDRRQLLLKKVE